jgi:hypothetical protein
MKPISPEAAAPGAAPAPEQIASFAAALTGADSLAQADLAEVGHLIGAALAFAYVNANRQRFAVMLEVAMDTAAELHQRIVRGNEAAAG